MGSIAGRSSSSKLEESRLSLDLDLSLGSLGGEESLDFDLSLDGSRGGEESRDFDLSVGDLEGDESLDLDPSGRSSSSSGGCSSSSSTSPGVGSGSMP